MVAAGCSWGGARTDGDLDLAGEVDARLVTRDVEEGAARERDVEFEEVLELEEVVVVLQRERRVPVHALPGARVGDDERVQPTREPDRGGGQRDRCVHGMYELVGGCGRRVDGT